MKGISFGLGMFVDGITSTIPTHTESETVSHILQEANFRYYVWVESGQQIVIEFQTDFAFSKAICIGVFSEGRILV